MVEQAEFRSGSANLRLFLDPRRYGLFQSDIPMKDQFGRYVIDPESHRPMTVPRPLETVKFGSQKSEARQRRGVYRVHEARTKDGVDLSDEERTRILEALRKHPDNMANKGTLFFEVGAETIRAVQAADGNPGALDPDDGITQEDIELLDRLSKAANGPVPPKALAARRDDLETALNRFRVVNVSLPPMHDAENSGVALKMLKTRLGLLLEALDNARIWPRSGDVVPKTEESEAE